MRGLFVLLLVVSALAGSAAPRFTHGITGIFKRAGRVNWKGFGYFSRTSQRWTPLKAPSLTGDAVTAAQIVGTSDGGAIIVGQFSAVNGRSAAGVAVFDPVRNDWFPSVEAGLYNARRSGGTLGCRSANGTGIAYVARDAMGNVITPVVSSTQVVMGAGFVPQAVPIRVPPAVNPNNGQTRVLDATDPWNQAQAPYFASIGHGRAIVADPSTADVFYIFGNFDLVGLNLDSPWNRDVQAAGLVQVTYDPSTKRLTPAIVGTRGYTARRVTDPTDTLHPRECGQAGNNPCTATDCLQSTINSPHRTDNIPQVGVTRGPTGIYFFVQEPNGDILRWTPEALFWVNVNVNGNGAGGSGQDLASSAALTADLNFRRTPLNSAAVTSGASTAGSAADFAWSISKDATTLYMWRRCYPNVAAFNDGLSNWGQLTWDDAANGNKGYFGGAKSTTAAATTFESVWTNENYPAAQFRNVALVNPGTATAPALSGQGPLASFAVSRTTQISLVDERLPGAPTFESNRYANTQFLKVKRVAGATVAAVNVDGQDNVQWANGPRGTAASLDANGNPRFPYDTGFTTLRNIREMNNNQIWVWSSNDNDIYYEPTLDLPPGHNGNTYGRRFKRAIHGGLMAFDGTTWSAPLGGGYGGAFAPIDFWETTVGDDDRVYVVDNGNTPVWNFAAQSGVTLYDDANKAWVDPFGSLRLVSLTENWYDASASSRWAEVGNSGTVKVSHKLETGQHLFAGTFTFVGDVAAGSIVQWAGENPGGGFTAVGAPNTGLFVSDVSLQSQPKRWIERFAPSTDNRKVGEGDVRAIANLGKRVFVGGVFDRSTNAVDSDNFLSNVAHISDISDTEAVWQDIDGGCDGAVTQLVVYQNQLYASGNFNNCGDLLSPKEGVARINAAVGANDHWQSLANGIQGGVNAMILWGDQLVIAGNFRSADNSGFGNIALWNGVYFTYLGSGCNDVCSNKLLTVGAGTPTANALGRRVNVPINSLAAIGSRLYAVLSAPGNAASGATTAGEIVYHDTQQWYRVSNGGVTAPTADALNGFLTTNGTSLVVANGALTDSPLTGNFVGNGDGNILSINSRGTDQVQDIEYYHGLQSVDGAIVHLSGAPSLAVGAALIVLLALIM